jgi:hypothetical protein
MNNFFLFLDQFAPKTFIPVLFGHASNDMFIQPHHTDRIHQLYAVRVTLAWFEKVDLYMESWIFSKYILSPLLTYFYFSVGR